MRRWKIILPLLLLIGLIALVFSVRPKQLSVKLADGSVLTVQKINFGKHEDLQPASWFDQFKRTVLEKLPRAWTARYLKAPPPNRSAWGSSSMGAGTNSDALQIYFNRRNPDTGKFLEVGIYLGDLIDEHGCVLVATAMGGSDRGLLPMGTRSSSDGAGSTLTWLTFEDFPREQKNFRLQVYDSTHKLMGELMLPNPAWPPKPREKWTAEAFPITKKQGDVTYTLLGVNVVTNWESRTNPSPRLYGPRFRGPLGIEPEFEIRSHGQLVDDWKVDDMDLTDSSGNVAPKQRPLLLYLCTNEPVWKLTIKFSGSVSSTQEFIFKPPPR